MRQYSFLQESVGRDLIGASRFSSRKSVASAIMQQYPNPQMLADRLQQMSQQTYGKERENLMNLSLKCRGLDMNSYPSFAKKISGFSGIWKIAGTTAAIAGTAAAANYLVNKTDEYITQNPNAGIKDTVKNVAGRTMQDIQSGIKRIPGATNAWGVVKNVPGATSINNAFKNGPQTLGNIAQSTRNGVNNLYGMYKTRVLNKYNNRIINPIDTSNNIIRYNTRMNNTA